MARKPKPKTQHEDEAQSKRFLDLASELEAAGDLSPTESEGALERVLAKGAPPKRHPIG